MNAGTIRKLLMLFRGVGLDDAGLLGPGDCTRDCGGWPSVLDEGPRRQCGARVRYHVLLICRRRNESRVDRIVVAWCVLLPSVYGNCSCVTGCWFQYLVRLLGLLDIFLI